MVNEMELLNERIESYMQIRGVKLTEDQKQNALNSIQLWFNYVIDDVVADAITGVTYKEVV